MNTSEIDQLKPRDVYYYRQRYKNRVYGELLKHFVSEAEANGITKKDIATRLGRDPAQVTRWLKEPSNLTLETISDLLLALDAEPDPPLPIGKFRDRPTPNYAHPLIARVLGMQVKVPKINMLNASPLPTSDAKSFTVKAEALAPLIAVCQSASEKVTPTRGR